MKNEDKVAATRKVYVTHQKDGYGGEMIAAIFDSEELAQDWIIAQDFTKNVFYAAKPLDELRSLANEFIEEHLVLTVSAKARSATDEIQ